MRVNSLAPQLLLALLLASSVSCLAEQDKLAPLSAGSNLRVKSLIHNNGIETDRIVSAEFAGTVTIVGKIRYGWVDSYSMNELEMQLELDPSSETKMPRLAEWGKQFYYDDFVLDNPGAVALRLFGRETLKRIHSREQQSAEVRAKLVLRKLGFGTDCGTHYGAEVDQVVSVEGTDLQIAGDWLDAHC